MARTHRVQQGECLASLAARYGFHDWRTIYDDAANADLRTLRPNPNALLPGDVVAIPDKGGRKVAAATEQRHEFKIRRQPTYLRVRLRDAEGQPMAGRRYVLAVGSDELTGTTDGDGLVEQRIDPRAQSAELRVYGDDPDVPEEVFALRLGHLDPVDTDSGARERLRNLGLLRDGPSERAARPPGAAADTKTGTDTNTGPAKDPAGPLARALRAFQQRHGLRVSGELDDATRQRLEREHDAR